MTCILPSSWPPYTIAVTAFSLYMLFTYFLHLISCIPRRKSGILRIQYGHATASEISFWIQYLKKYFSQTFQIWYVGIYGQCYERYSFVILTFNFKVTGGPLKVRLWPFFSFWPSSHIQKVRSSYRWYI